MKLEISVLRIDKIIHTSKFLTNSQTLGNTLILSLSTLILKFLKDILKFWIFSRIGQRVQTKIWTKYARSIFCSMKRLKNTKLCSRHSYVYAPKYDLYKWPAINQFLKQITEEKETLQKRKVIFLRPSNCRPEAKRSCANI